MPARTLGSFVAILLTTLACGGSTDSGGSGGTSAGGGSSGASTGGGSGGASTGGSGGVGGDAGCDCNLLHATSQCDAFGKCTVVQCDVGWTDCNNSAIDGCEVHLEDNTHHCGSCGNDCTLANAGALCQAGVCQVLCDCQPNWLDCDGSKSNCCETNAATDDKHCGSCGVACPAGQSCVNGSCK